MVLAYSQFQLHNRLAQMGVLLASEQHLPKLYDLIVRESMALTNAQVGSILIREGDYLFASSTRSEPPLDDKELRAYSSARFARNDEGLFSAVLDHSQSLNLSDLHMEPEGRPAALWSELSLFADRRFQSLLALPLQTPQSGQIGILFLLNARSYDGELGAFDPQLEELMMAVSSQASLAIQNIRWSKQLHQAYQDTLYRLSLVAKYREDPSGAQIRRISQYSAILSEALGLPEERVDKIRVASALYDIGKLGIPEAILLKPGRLTAEEFDRMKQHTTLGAVILGGSQTEILQTAEKIALTHHEKFDGSGYPNGQAGLEIPLEGRIVALAEVFDALTSDRPYKAPMDFEQAVEVIRSESGKHFDPSLVGAFLKSAARFKAVMPTPKA